jgi:hypothetical protein
MCAYTCLSEQKQAPALDEATLCIMHGFRHVIHSIKSNCLM